MRRIPFTIALAALIVGTGLIAGTAWHPLAADVARRVAFAPIDVRTGSWHRLISSLAFTGGPASFWKVLALIPLSCGAYEWRRGTRATAAGFAFVHLMSLAIVSAVVLLGSAHGWWWAGSLAEAYDVGPSIGCYGCFGMLLGDAMPRWRAILGGGFLVVASVNLALHLETRAAVELSSDFEHTLAIVIGWACRPREPFAHTAAEGV